jgi:pimeloyl-ACP methyl ester carboxylesterase
MARRMILSPWRSIRLIATSLLAAAPAGMPLAAQAPAGPPAIILESGLGDGAAPWKAVRKLLGETPVFAYDRPGYGGTEAATAPRDPCTIARELHARLAQGGVRPPYLLVGHSLGGRYQYAFARLFPEDVAGLVLVDATHPDHWTGMKREAPAAAQAVKLLRGLMFSRTMRREFDDQDVCMADLPQTAFAFPVRVLAKTRHEPLARAQMQRLEGRLQTDWLRLTGAAKVEPIADSGHYIQRDQPRRLAGIIRELLAAASVPAASAR